VKGSQFVVRFPDDLALKVDQVVKLLRGTSSGVRVTRSDAIRFLVRKGIEGGSLDLKNQKTRAKRGGP